MIFQSLLNFTIKYVIVQFDEENTQRSYSLMGKQIDKLYGYRGEIGRGGGYI